MRKSEESARILAVKQVKKVLGACGLACLLSCCSVCLLVPSIFKNKQYRRLHNNTWPAYWVLRTACTRRAKNKKQRPEKTSTNPQSKPCRWCAMCDGWNIQKRELVTNSQLFAYHSSILWVRRANKKREGVRSPTGATGDPIHVLWEHEQKYAIDEWNTQ